MAWGSKPDIRSGPGRWLITKNGHEVGTFAVIDPLYYPETVMAGIVAALEHDTAEGRF